MKFHFSGWKQETAESLQCQAYKKGQLFQFRVIGWPLQISCLRSCLAWYFSGHSDSTHKAVSNFSTCICQKPITVRPLNLEAVEANHVFQIHEYYNQAVELISQPEICEAHLVEGSGEHSKLLKEKGIICVTF